MNTTARARTLRRPPRAITLIIAAAFSGTGLLLAGCAGTSASSAARAGAGSAHEAVGAVPAAPAPAAVHQAGLPAASRATRLAVSSQSIIYTASLTVQAKDVTAAAKRAVAIVNAAGGYTSNEHESLRPGKHALAVVSLQLKFPVAQYPAALGQLSKLGTRTSLTRQAQDVTQQVADVSSRVTSAQAAITQLRALLRRAGSVSSLLSVQDQINAEESSLEALLTGLGAALPFALIAALAGGIVYGSRRRLVRRKSRPTAAQ
jgi:hypothetical protein